MKGNFKFRRNYNTEPFKDTIIWFRDRVSRILALGSHSRLTWRWDDYEGESVQENPEANQAASQKPTTCNCHSSILI